MEKYRKNLLLRIWLMVGVGLAMLGIFFLNTMGILEMNMGTEFSDFHQGFQFGGMLFILGLFVYLSIGYGRAISNPEQLKKLYIAEKDERIGTIREKSGGNPLFICATTILFFAVIAGYFNEIVFGTLLGCSLFLFVTRKILMIYYSRVL